MTPVGGAPHRRDFVPDRIWYHREGDGRLVELDRVDDPEHWNALVDADDAVVTRVKADRWGTLWPTSSSSAPFVMRAMLKALDVHPGMRVLEIGTGTGYNAALLARAGADVVTVDIDAEATGAAEAALTRAGLDDRVTVLTADGGRGAPQHAPFDRVIATAAVHTVPYTWVEQTRRDGLIVLPHTGPLHPGALIVLTVTGGRASGRAVDEAYFMPLDTQRDIQQYLQREADSEALRHLRMSVDGNGQTTTLATAPGG